MNVDGSTTVAVTGAGGHLGSQVVAALMERGARVRAITRRAQAHLAASDVDCLLADVRDGRALEAAFQGCQLVIHCAGPRPGTPDAGDQRSVLLGGSLAVARAAAAVGARRLVHVGGLMAMDLTAGREVDAASPRAVGPFAVAFDRAKAEAEAAVFGVGQASGLEVVVVHPGGLLGPGERSPGPIDALLLDLWERRLAVLPAGGYHWVDVRDVASGVLSAAVRGQPGAAYLLAGHPASLKELAELASRFTRTPAPRLQLPLWVTALASPALRWWAHLLGRPPRLTVDLVRTLGSTRRVRWDRAARDLGFEPRPLDESVADTLTWLARLPTAPRPRLRRPQRRRIALRRPSQ